MLHLESGWCVLCGTDAGFETPPDATLDCPERVCVECGYALWGCAVPTQPAASAATPTSVASTPAA